MTAHYRIAQMADFARSMRRARAGLRHERMSEQELRTLQQSRLESLVRFAIENSRFYAEWYRGVDLAKPIPLDALPPVDKTTLIERFEDWVTDCRIRRDDVERHAQQIDGDTLYLDEYRLCATGGTSGERGLFLFSRRDWIEATVGFVRHTNLLGFAPRWPRWRIATVAAVHALHMTARFSQSADFGLHRVQRLDVRKSLAELTAVLNAFQPEILFGYPSALALLALEQLDGRLHIQPRIVVTSSETRTAEMEARIVAAWQRRPHDIYASTETGIMAVDCDRHTGRHIFEDLVIVENVDADGRPVPDGEAGHHLLVTNLWNKTQPLIRYTLTDMATIESSPCPCGRTLRRLTDIQGRSDDVLELRGIDGRIVPVHPLTLRSPFAALSDLKQYQIIYDGHTLLVRAVPTAAAANDALCNRISELTERKLHELGIAPITVAVELAESLARGAGHAGKFKLVEVRRRSGAA